MRREGMSNVALYDAVGKTYQRKNEGNNATFR